MGSCEAALPQADSTDSYPIGMAGLSRLMAITEGDRRVSIGLIDGPVAVDHPDLSQADIRPVAGRNGACARGDQSCVHGTFVAGVLAARRGSAAPAICPGCSLLVRPIFASSSSEPKAMPTATADELAEAIRESISAGARVLNVSGALLGHDAPGERRLTETLDLASLRGVLVVVAAGNQGLVGSTTITRHPWTVPVVAYRRSGLPQGASNLGRSIGRTGIGAPGEDVVSLAPGGSVVQLSGTSAAAPFVTGTAALLWSLFPEASAAQLRFALTQVGRSTRRTVPPLMDAWAAYGRMRSQTKGGRPHAWNSRSRT